MAFTGKKLGILISACPSSPPFRHGIALAREAGLQGVRVFLYFVDDAVEGVRPETVSALEQAGVRMSACAFGVQKRRLVLPEAVLPAGLAAVSELMAETDRFVAFNA